MLADLVLRGDATGDAVVTPSGVTSWAELRRMTGDAVERFHGSRGRRVVVVCVPAPETFAALAALDAVGAEAVLADSDLGAGALELPDGAEGREAGVVVLTSGTTGRPRETHHAWAALAAQARPRVTDLMPRWASGYRVRLFASLQVLLQAWVSRGAIVCGAPRAPEGIARFWAAARVGYASATPSFWRRLALGADRDALRRIPLRQVTLGGEAADQPLLDQLRILFPRARITHIYATSELGRCLAISDGRAGFPAALLSAPQVGGRELRVEGGELLVRVVGGRDPLGCRAPGEGPARRSPEGEGGWRRTGDLIVIEGSRAYFAGRRDDILNVGGEKVAPLAVERVLREAPGVADVRVFGRRSSLAGQLVGCEIVPASGAVPDLVREAVGALARARLSAAQQPRFIEIVDRIAVSSADKVARQEAGA